MSIIALDIHPQCKFSCFAANDKQCVHHPHEIVPELNHQSTFADKRVLVESQPDNHLHDFCSSFFQRHDTPRFLQESDSHFGQYVQHCQSNGLLSGLPNP
nr:isochorismatase [Neisseria sp.]